MQRQTKRERERDRERERERERERDRQTQWERGIDRDVYRQTNAVAIQVQGVWQVCGLRDGQTEFPVMLCRMVAAPTVAQACAIATDAGARQQEPKSCVADSLECGIELQYAEAFHRGDGRSWKNRETYRSHQGSAS